MKPEMIAEEYKKGFDCSQVVLGAFAEKLKISKEEAYKMSACFGGGMGAKGGTCGAIAGALIAIGLKYGQCDADHMEQKSIMAEKRAAFLEKIQKKYPSVTCNDIIGYDLTKEEDLQTALEKGLLLSLCPVVAADVIDALDEVL